MLNMRNILLILGIFCLAACGQKGALYLPEVGIDKEQTTSRKIQGELL